jgi:rhodanese-related sulfurtransferase
MTTAQTETNQAPPQRDLTPAQIESKLAEGRAVLIDVREEFEHAEEKIEGAALHPLSKLDAAEVEKTAEGREILLHCRSGNRSGKAMAKLAESGVSASHLAGGIEAWKASGRPVERSARAPRIGVMRQVQITAGFLVLIGVLLGAFVSEWFLVLSGFVGAGLMFAGVSGWCGMAMLLAKMPWNKTGCGSDSKSGASCAA